MADIEDGHYNNSHRAFVQAFMARSVLTFDQAKPILAHIQSVHDSRETLPGDVTEADFNAYITTANNALSPYDYEIRSTFSQHDRTRIYALVNTTSDPATQLATLHTADEIAFLKRVLDAMFETNNTTLREVMAVTSMQALQLHKNPSVGQTQNGGATQGSTGPGLTMSQAEKMLKDLVEEGWFELSKKGYYSLTPRALIELRGWLLQTYNEPDDEDEGEQEQRVDRIKLCQACKEIVTIGQRCPNRECPCRLHNFCTRNIFRIEKAERCPICKTGWTDPLHVGEKAAGATTGARRSTGGPSRRDSTRVDSDDE